MSVVPEPIDKPKEPPQKTPEVLAQTQGLTDKTLSNELLRSAADLVQKVNAHVGSNGDPAVMATFVQPPSYIVLILIVSALVLTGYIIGEMANYFEIKNNWDIYRCDPAIAPFAAFYGYNLSENMNYCISQSVKEHSPGVINPIYAGINQVSNTIDGVYGKVSSIEKGVSGLLNGFQSFIMEFVNAFSTIGTRIRMVIIRIKDIFGRVYGIFISFVFAAISALTFGTNLVCNPLVAFLGTIMGYDTCCFAPDTLILMADGSKKPIVAVTIGDLLADDSRVTSLYEFDGSTVPMVLINGIHVSSNHYLAGPDGSLVQAGDYPGAAKATSLTRIWCLGTSNNRIPVFSPVIGQAMQFTDYEESEDPEVIAEVQAIAEKELNGTSSVVGPPVSDYSLGIDPTVQVFMRDRTWKPLTAVRIGDELMGGGVVTGIIHEVCDSIRHLPGGFITSAAQLVLVGGQWKRAAHLFPADPNYRNSGRVLYQLMVTTNMFVIKRVNMAWTVRDYAEVSDTAMQAPYDKKMISKTSLI